MTHFTGHIAAVIRGEINAVTKAAGGDGVTIDRMQQNGTYGVQQARVTLTGDPLTYRLIIAPADAPITINGRPIGRHFAKPLGDR